MSTSDNWLVEECNDKVYCITKPIAVRLRVEPELTDEESTLIVPKGSLNT